MTSIGIRTLALLIASTLWLAGSHAADPGPRFDEEVSKQEKIYRSQGEQTVEGYTVDRSLAVYSKGLSPEFARTLANLGPTDRWLDIGAGEGRAILDYFTQDYDMLHPEGRERRGRKAQAVAISIEDRSTPLWRQTATTMGGDQLQYLSGKRLREYSVEELGQFQVITDVVGGFSYTQDLSRFMENVLGLLAVNGSFYSILQDIQWEDGTNRPFYEGSGFLSQIADANGAELKICSWLKRITCAEVMCESKADWVPPMEAFRVRKICNGVTVPALATVRYEAGTPPERRFQLKDK